MTPQKFINLVTSPEPLASLKRVLRRVFSLGEMCLHDSLEGFVEVLKTRGAGGN